MLLQEKPFQNNIHQVVFNIIYGFICISPFLGGEYTGILIGAAYIQFLTIAKHRETDWVVKVCTTGLLLSVTATLFLLAIHWDVILNGEGTPDETLKSVGWFGAAFMIIDAVRFQVKYYKIDIKNFAKWLLILAICAVPAKLLFFSTFFNVSFINYFDLTSRNVAFLDLNPNYADDVLIAYLVVIAWAVAVLSSYFLNNKTLAAVTILIAFFMIFQIFVANSRAAYLGLMCSFLIVFFLSFRHISTRTIIIMFGIGLISLFFIPDRVLDRLNQTTEQIESILQTYDSNNINEAEELAAIASVKKDVLDIYANTSKELSITAVIQKECWPRLIQLSGIKDDRLALPFRFYIFQDALKIWSIHPYLGYGAYDKKTILAKTKNVNPCRIAYFSGVHNQYLDIAIRGGLFALFSFVVLSCVFFYLLVLSLTYCANNRLMSLIVFFYFPYLYVQNLTGISFYKKADLSAILITMAVLLSINLIQQPKNKSLS